MVGAVGPVGIHIWMRRAALDYLTRIYCFCQIKSIINAQPTIIDEGRNSSVLVGGKECFSHFKRLIDIHSVLITQSHD